MKHVLILGLVALSLALAGLLAFLNASTTELKTIPQTDPVSGYGDVPVGEDQTVPIDADKFLVTELYKKAWSIAPETAVCHTYRAAIVNHHALASDLIVKTLQEIVRCRKDLKTIIILSPDHYAAGAHQITTHRASYATAGERVNIDTKVVDRLERSVTDIGEDPRIFEREHGIGVLIPFLHRLATGITIVPIAIKSSVTQKQLDELATWLRSESELGNFLLVSSDMSHYLDKTVAKTNDERTKRAFVENDVSFFREAKDRFTDNGPSIAATIQALGSPRFSLLDQAISSDYSGSTGFTTSYLVGAWY